MVIADDGGSWSCAAAMTFSETSTLLTQYGNTANTHIIQV